VETGGLVTPFFSHGNVKGEILELKKHPFFPPPFFPHERWRAKWHRRKNFSVPFSPSVEGKWKDLTDTSPPFPFPFLPSCEIADVTQTRPPPWRSLEKRPFFSFPSPTPSKRWWTSFVCSFRVAREVGTEGRMFFPLPDLTYNVSSWPAQPDGPFSPFSKVETAIASFFPLPW